MEMNPAMAMQHKWTLPRSHEARAAQTQQPTKVWGLQRSRHCMIYCVKNLTNDRSNWFLGLKRIRGIGHFLTSAVMTTWFLSSDKTWSRAFQASASISLMTPRWRFQDDKKLKTKLKRDWVWKLRVFQVDWSTLSKLLSAYRCYLVTLIILSLVRPKQHMFNGR